MQFTLSYKAKPEPGLTSYFQILTKPHKLVFRLQTILVTSLKAFFTKSKRGDLQTNDHDLFRFGPQPLINLK